MSDTGRGAGCGTRRMRYPGLNQIRLLQGSPFYDRQRDMNEFLIAQDPDSMLYNFRRASGLPTGDAEPMTGWDADECKLKGHTTGHYMSGLALAYAATGDVRFREKLTYMISGLRECQEAFARSGRTADGFLSAYDEEQFDLLEQYTKYPEIWAPYYTLDKIMSGLLDAYELAGIDQALEILDPLGDWVYARLSRLPDEQRNEMWSMYIAGEYGAMIGTMVRLYRFTGKADHLAAARFFENPALFGQMAAGEDGLDTMHANQHIPQIMGAVELYRETGERKYLDIAKNFWKIVTHHHCYSIGGTGEEERWHAADSETSYLTDKTAESCASYNMLRLTSMLFEEDELDVADLMEYYERTLFNHILMSCSHAPDGGTTYFLPLAPGSTKYYEKEENSCCHGTGMESRYRYMSQIFSYSGYDLLMVNLPISAKLEGEEDITVQFDDGFCAANAEISSAATGEIENNSEGKDGGAAAIMRITAGSDMKRRLAVRIPEWACICGEVPEFRLISANYNDNRSDDSGIESRSSRSSICINSDSTYDRDHITVDDANDTDIRVRADLEIEERSGKYVILSEPMRKGDVLEIRLPLVLREIRAKSEPEYTSLAYGPYILAAISDSTEYINVESLRESSTFGCRCCGDGMDIAGNNQDIEKMNNDKIAGPIILRPLFKVDGEHYHIYFR